MDNFPLPLYLWIWTNLKCHWSKEPDCRGWFKIVFCFCVLQGCRRGDFRRMSIFLFLSLSDSYPDTPICEKDLLFVCFIYFWMKRRIHYFYLSFLLAFSFFFIFLCFFLLSFLSFFPYFSFPLFFNFLYYEPHLLFSNPIDSRGRGGS